MTNPVIVIIGFGEKTALTPRALLNGRSSLIPLQPSPKYRNLALCQSRFTQKNNSISGCYLHFLKKMACFSSSFERWHPLEKAREFAPGWRLGGELLTRFGHVPLL